MPVADPLKRQLLELLQLFDSVLGQGTTSAAVYDPGDALYCWAGTYSFAPTFKQSTHENMSVSKIEVRGLADPYHLLVHRSGPVEPDLNASLRKVGVRFLSNTLGLLHQASRLELLLKEQDAIINHISDGLIVLDQLGILRYLNIPGGKILGVNPRDNIGRRFADVIDFEPFITEIFRTKRGYVDRELRITSSKVDIHILDTAVPILNEDGEVVSIVNTFHEIARARQLSNRMAGDRARYRFSDILGKSQILTAAIETAKRAARSDANVLLYGESGTGKEVFAQSIHNGGRRATAPFVAVNCAALPRDLIESELFGYAPGSFTGADKSGRLGRFELATGGTIFLDEISEMPLDVQAKLLRVLQERQVTRIGGGTSVSIDVRIIAAANRELPAMVASNSFREDLYYRLNVLRIDIPPLRMRREDVDPLIEESVRRTCTLMHRPMLRLGPVAMARLRNYHWPGNVRELQNIVERLVNMTDGETVGSVPEGWLDISSTAGRSGLRSEGGKLLSLAEAENRAIAAAMHAHDDNITKAAHSLGITRPTLYAKLRRSPAKMR